MSNDAAARGAETGAAGPTQVVDYQTHWYPRSYIESLVGRKTVPVVQRTSDDGRVLLLDEGCPQPGLDGMMKDLEEHLADASAVGTDVLVIGPATLGEVLHLPADEAAELLDSIHEQYAAAQRAHPDRVACLAALPMQDPAVALAVLERAIVELNLRGVALIAANEGRPLATDVLLPVYARIAQLGVPIFLHPGFRTTTRPQTQTRRAEIGLAWMYHTALAALELVDGGVLDAVPDLIVVHPHLGGVLPYIAGRISPLDGGGAQEPLEHYLKTRFYADTAGSTPGALDLAIEMYGIDRLVFATDHPALPMSVGRRYVDDNLSPQLAARIYANRIPGLGTSGPQHRAEGLRPTR